MSVTQSVRIHSHPGSTSTRVILIACVLVWVQHAAAGPIEISAGSAVVSNSVVRLSGKDAQQQLLVTSRSADGMERDLTREMLWTISPPQIASVDSSGRVTPLRDGEATLIAKSSDGTTTSIPLVVERTTAVSPVSFPNRIVPIFTKTGCNAGGCHGKAGGQNGFRLSLLGFEPTEDYEHLLKEARGRRLFPASPENSLLLLKATGTLPHGGGKRVETDSDDYKLLVRWIAQGMPYGNTNEPTITGIEVFPQERTMAKDASQQLVVTARYSDGSTEDVTRSALFEANDKELARVDESGRVQLLNQPGDVAVMVRYQAKVAVFRATIPLGAPVTDLPTARNFIDDAVFKKLKKMGMPPSAPCDDATFIRRVTLDVAGRLPTPDETQKFVADQDPAKRDRWIDQLLSGTEYADYFANKWSALLRNKRTEEKQARGTYAFHDWIRDGLAENKPFDQFVREIIAASGEVMENPPVAWYRQVRDQQQQLEDTAQLFLGMRLQCAQCHHHPYEKWSQKDYYSFAAFFSQVGRKTGAQPGEEMIYTRRSAPSATNKKNKQSVKPSGLGSPALELSADDDAREALADWMTSPDNPFFAKSLVNRYWKHFFNRGIVDPEDDMRETNPPTNPELLDALAKYFAEAGFDLKALVRTICQSKVYQLSAVPNEYNKVDRQNFSRYYPKRLTAEVLYDAINQVTRSSGKFDGLPAGTRAVCLPDNSFNANSYFLTVFGRPDSSSACECERSQDASLAQSLHLLNAKELQEKLSADNGRAAALASDTRTGDQKLRELYLWAYSRPPEATEIKLAEGHLGKTVKDKDGKELPIDQRRAYEDIVWALINTKEFLFNH